MKMKRKMIGLWMGAVMAVTMLAGCGSKSSEPAGETESTSAAETEEAPAEETGESAGAKTLKVASIHSLNLPYHNWLKTEFEARAKEYGFEFTAFNNEQDDSQTVSIVQDCIEQGYDVILFPLTQGDQSDLVQQARDAGIAMVSFNLSTDWANGVVTQIVCDEHGLGYASGQQAAKELPENAKIVILQGMAGIDASTGRRAGYEDGLLAERPDIEVLADSYADFDKAKAMALMDDWIQAYDQIDGVMAEDDGMALGAYESLVTNGKDTSKIKIYGINGLAEGCQAVIDGELAGTVLQSAITFADIIFDDLLSPYADGELDLVNYTEKIEFDAEIVDLKRAEELLAYFESIGMSD